MRMTERSGPFGMSIGTRGTISNWALLGCSCTLLLSCSLSPRPGHDPFASIERRIGGRLGIALVAADGELLLHRRANERFAMCSTFKAPLAATVLDRVATGALSLSEQIPFSRQDLVPYAPTIEANLERGHLSVDELCRAAIQLSDNVAANLLLARLGGPAELNAFFRRNGDTETRLDRYEPELNENAIGDPRDTTTPRAMALLMARILSSGLRQDERTHLSEWLRGSRTGKRRIRAGVPPAWPIGNKTGTSTRADAAVYCDVAVIEPPNREMAVLAVYCDRPVVPSSDVDAAIAEVAQIACARLDSL